MMLCCCRGRLRGRKGWHTPEGRSHRRSTLQYSSPNMNITTIQQSAFMMVTAGALCPPSALLLPNCLILRHLGLLPGSDSGVCGYSGGLPKEESATSIFWNDLYEPGTTWPPGGVTGRIPVNSPGLFIWTETPCSITNPGPGPGPAPTGILRKEPWRPPGVAANLPMKGRNKWMRCSNKGGFCFSTHLWTCPCSPCSLARLCLGPAASPELRAMSTVKFPAHLRASGGRTVPG